MMMVHSGKFRYNSQTLKNYQLLCKCCVKSWKLDTKENVAYIIWQAFKLEKMMWILFKMEISCI